MIGFAAIEAGYTSFEGTICIVGNIQNPIPLSQFFCVKSLSFSKRFRPNRSFSITKIDEVSKSAKGGVEIFIGACLH